MEQTQIQIPIETTTQDTGAPTKEQKEPTKEELEARLNGLLTSSAKDTRKKFYFAIIKQSDGSYNYYPLTFPMKGQAAVTKAFSMKGINASQVKVNIMDTNSRVVLETNAIEQSKNPNKLKEFLALYKDQKLEIRVDDNLVINVEYPITAEIMEKYKDVIAEMNGYSGFSSQLITQ